MGKVEKALELSKNRLSMGGPETPRPHGQVQVAIRASLGPEAEDDEDREKKNPIVPVCKRGVTPHDGGHTLGRGWATTSDFGCAVLSET